MKQKTKKTIALTAGIFCAAAIGVGIFFGTGLSKGELSPEDTLIKINNEEVSKEEFQTLLIKYRANVMSSYTTDQVNQSDFWETAINGEKPVELITEKTLEELTEKKVIKQMAVSEGLIKDFSFETLKEGLIQENQERESNVENNQIIYGKTEYDLETYYEYIYSNIETVLSRQLRSQSDITEEAISDYYQQNKEDYYCDEIVSVIDAQSETDTDLQQAAERMKEEDLTALQEQYPDIVFSELTLSTIDTQAQKSGVYQNRWETAKTLETGEISEIYTAGSGYGILYCKERKEQEYLSLSQEEDTIRAILQEKSAQETMQKEIRNARITYHDEQLEQAALEILKEQ